VPTLERMPRQPRIQVPGGIYHVDTKGCAERFIFVDDVDRTSFEEILALVVRKHEWSCSSFCLMGTHYHLLVTTPHGDLAEGMHRLNGLYAQTFNRRHGAAGHVFMSRYHAEFIQTDSHLLETTRYVALNPVRAGLCERPEDWPWSSFAETIGMRPARPYIASDVLLELFADDPELARARFHAFVMDKPPAPSS
jgi:putative transposase